MASVRSMPRSVGIKRGLNIRNTSDIDLDDFKNPLDSDLDELNELQVDDQILRNLNNGSLTKDLDGYTPETRAISTNTKPVLRQPIRNESGMIVSIEGNEKNYDLDIELVDTKYSEKEFLNAIDIEFREINELKKIPELSKNEQDLVSKLKSDLGNRNNKIKTLNKELDDTKIAMKSLEATVNNVINNPTNIGNGISQIELDKQIKIATLKERLIHLEEELSNTSSMNLGLQIQLQQKIIVLKDELKSLGVNI